jgi:hypothetical protein
VEKVSRICCNPGKVYFLICLDSMFTGSTSSLNLSRPDLMVVVCLFLALCTWLYKCGPAASQCSMYLVQGWLFDWLVGLVFLLGQIEDEALLHLFPINFEPK